MPTTMDDFGQSRFELLESQRLTQIRISSNDCIIDEAELDSKFPWIEPKCVNIFDVSLNL